MNTQGGTPIVHRFISLGDPDPNKWKTFIEQIPRHQWDAGEWLDEFHINETPSGEDENVWTFTHIGANID